MTQAISEIEVELLARDLQRDEKARQVLGAGTSRWVYGVASAATAVLIQFLAQAWQGLPAYAGIAIAALVGTVAWQSIELYVAKRRINAIIHLLRLPADNQP